MITSLSALLRMRYVSDRICRENHKTQFVLNNVSLPPRPPENRAFYEIMWKNIVEPYSPQMTIWRMSLACWLPKAANTHSICNTYCFFTATIVTRTRLNITLYIHCLSCKISQQRYPIAVCLFFTFITYVTPS
jgi:hypothetical protein